MIEVLSVGDSKQRWDDYMAVYEACEASGLPTPSESLIMLGPQPDGWRENYSLDVLAAYLHTGHGLVNIDGVLYDWRDGIDEIKKMPATQCDGQNTAAEEIS
jgi:hypothetical protein